EPGAALLLERLERAPQGPVGARVALLLARVTQAHERAQAVRLEREARMRAGEEQDLLRAGLADAGELLQRGARLPEPPREPGLEVPAETLRHQGRDLEPPFGAVLGVHPATARDVDELLARRAQEAGAARTGALLQRAEAGEPLLEGHEIARVL